ncbi:MAG: hypothetical protein JWL64_1000, partial [Frankiales bacterium]|nr:hypothetical protein [Frankiales bacterium]
PGAAAAGLPPGAAPVVFDATEATFEDLVLRRSLTVPVLVDFWADWCGPCKQLSPLLERLAAEGGGAWALAKIDVDTNQQLAGSLQIQSIPTVLLALGGRLIQGFTGALPEQELKSFVDQVLAAAQKAGLPGPGGDPDAEPVGPPPEPEVLQAEEALEQGDYAAAEAAYDALLQRRPGDPMATAGRASVALFRRVDGVDVEGVLARADSAPDDVAAQLAAADVEIISDHVDQAVTRLVAVIRRTAGDERDTVRARLLDLFAVLDPADPRVIAGRRALASALF